MYREREREREGWQERLQASCLSVSLLFSLVVVARCSLRGVPRSVFPNEHHGNRAVKNDFAPRPVRQVPIISNSDSSLRAETRPDRHDGNFIRSESK